MLVLTFIAILLSLPESMDITQLLLGSLHLPSAGAEIMTQANLKIALQVLGLLASSPDSLKQSVSQSLGMQALQYSWWWNKTGKATWQKSKAQWQRFNAWRKGLPQTQLIITWHIPKPITFKHPTHTLPE